MQIKVSELENRKILVQLIDMSDKMLYNEVKAEQEFIAIINVTISHQLRNPLNGLTGEVIQIKEIQKKLQDLQPKLPEAV